MTEQKRTTAERIETILRRDLDVDVIVSRGGDPHYNEADIVGVNIAAQTIAAEIDTLTRERDDVRAQVKEADSGIAALNTQLAEARNGIDALKVEVERLRPAAEAWELQRRYAAMFADNLRGRVSDVDLACLESEYEAAAARAAAKESLP